MQLTVVFSSSTANALFNLLTINLEEEISQYKCKKERSPTVAGDNELKSGESWSATCSVPVILNPVRRIIGSEPGCPFANIILLLFTSHMDVLGSLWCKYFSSDEVRIPRSPKLIE
jgi:hypothetical protein